MPAPTAPPRSVTRQWVAFVGCGGFLATCAALTQVELSRAQLILLAMLGTALPMVLLELGVRRVHRTPSTGLDFEGPAGGLQLGRVAVKLLGFYATIAVIAFLYWVIPEYENNFYTPWWALLRIALAPVLLGSIPYFALVDRRMHQPRDGYWHAGMLLLGRARRIDRKALREHALGWIIKGFYLPLMTVYLGNAASYLTGKDPLSMMDSFPHIVTYISKLSLGIDLAFVSIGYVLMLRVLDTHIRSPNPFMYGWVFTLMLYRPFWGNMSKRFFDHSDGEDWLDHLEAVPALVVVWGILIIVSKLGWAWANLSFGLRFSNLTHRGVITNGPYRWFKHPSYLFKNLSWWLLSVPFLCGDGPAAALQHSAALLGVNLLYVVRARAEEQHLSEDPDYVRYALWMNEHGALARLGRWLTFLRYRPPDGWDP